MFVRRGILNCKTMLRFHGLWRMFVEIFLLKLLAINDLFVTLQVVKYL